MEDMKLTTNYKEIPINELNEKVAVLLQEIDNIKAPEWSQFVKTGHHKQRPPARKDWWFMRAASILTYIDRIKGPIGVSKLRVKYGGKKNRGVRPEKFFRSSGSIIRTILQQLEEAKLLKTEEKKGRAMTPQGISLLSKAAIKK
jgi:small subunit ribosomal protein S19e